MRANRVRTGKATQAAIVGLGVAGALGTAAALGAATLHPTTSDDAWSPAPATTESRTVVRTQRGEDDDDEGGRTRVSRQRVTVQPAPAPAPAPNATSSGS